MNKIEQLSLLQAARLLIDDQSMWTKGAQARKEDGIRASATDEQAVSWCSFGAVRAFLLETDSYHQATDHLRNACQAVFGSPEYISSNDQRDHKSALRVFDKAIETLALEIDGPSS